MYTTQNNLPAAPQAVTQEQANAWVALATEKNRIAFELQKAELAAQNILLPVQNSTSYPDIDKALSEYRKAHLNTVEIRKGFTSMVDANIIQPLMAFEKRIDPKTNEIYIHLSNTSLTLRKEESLRAATENARNQEAANFKAHVQNEFQRIVWEYKQSIQNAFNDHYKKMLQERVKDPALDKVREFVRQIAPPPAKKFNAEYLKPEELQQIYLQIEAPDYEKVYDDLMLDLQRLFANYANDLANADAAIKHREEQAKLQQIEEERKAKEEQAMNTLIATAETVEVEEPKIKRTLQVTVVESEQWAKAVMAAFITNLPHLAKYIRVRSWSKLNIGQMATYLGQYATDEGVTFSNLNLEEVEK